jgi:hypothetical protein
MKLSSTRLVIVTAILLAAGAGTRAQHHEARPAKASSVQLGDAVIVIPDPEGFEEATSQFPKYKERIETTEAPINDVLLAHLPVSDCELLRKGSNPTYNLYTKISVLKAAREVAISREIMASGVDGFRKNVGTYLDPNGPELKRLQKHIEQGLSRVDATETTIDFSKPQQLGEFNIGADVHSFLMLMTLTVAANGKQATVPMLSTTTFLRAKERVVFVYAFMKYRSNADLDTIKQFTTKWTSSIIAANRR